MPAPYDIFLSHAWKDGALPQQIADALRKAGLRVWFDADETDDFASITRAVTEGLAKSKALVAYYSKTYPLRRACQWELTVAFLAAQTEGDPRRRVLVVNPEKGADHIHPIELRDAKFRSAPSTDGEMQQLVQAIVKHVGELSDPLADIHPLDPPAWHGIKPVRYEQFVGRFQEMWQIHSALHETRVVQITASSGQDIAQVTGLGGIGKSLLAREYALRFGPAYPGGVFWMSAHGNDDAKATLSDEGRDAERNDQLSKFAQDFGIDAVGKQLDEILNALRLELERRGKACLWIVDDLPSGLNAEAFQLWCAPHPLARTLITTRSRTYGNLGSAAILSLEVLPENDAYQLLVSRRKPASRNEQEQARELAEDLGYHALAIDVTASALVEYGDAEPFRRFREELADRDRDALELAKDLADVLPNGHEASITQTMLRSIRGLGEEGLDFLRLASVLAVAPIPASLVCAVFQKADGLDHGKAEQRQRNASHDVTKASLAEIVGEKQDARSVHTLVSRAVRFYEKSAPERVQGLRAAAVEALRSEIGKAGDDLTFHKQIDFHVAHARQLISALASVSEAHLVTCVAQYDYARGSYAMARTLYKRQLEFWRRELGPEHPQTLISVNNLSLMLSKLGDLTGARKVHEETLASQRRVLGSEHPDTLTSMNNLAETLQAQGDLAGARKLYEEALTIRRRVLAPEHPEALLTVSNLAVTLSALGDYATARKLNEESLPGFRRVLGPEHPRTLSSMNNLACSLQAQGDLSGARKLFEEVLAIHRRVLGPEHPDTLTLMNNLAESLRSHGDFAGARALNEEALAVTRRVLGQEHPHTLTQMASLAVTLREQGDFASARKLEEEVLQIRGHVLGGEHPDTLTAMGNLACTVRAQGDWARARTLLEEVVTIHSRVLGPKHPDTLTSITNLAEALLDEGDLAGARRLQEETLEISRQMLGPEHPHTLTLASNLAVTIGEMGDSAGARKLKEELLAIHRRVLGSRHPDTATSINNLATTLYALGDLAGARKLEEEALEIRRQALGPEHPDTLGSISNLGSILQAQDDLAGARKLHAEALATRRKVLGPQHPNTLTSMNNIASTLYALGDLAGARKLEEDALEIKRQVLGTHHESTIISAWNLFRTLQDSNDLEAARALLRSDLVGLLDRNPATMSAGLLKIRQSVAQAILAGEKKSVWKRIFR